jgi:hypothetical protein
VDDKPCCFCMLPVQICATQVVTTAKTLTMQPSKLSCTSFTWAMATPWMCGEKSQHTFMVECYCDVAAAPEATPPA